MCGETLKAGARVCRFCKAQLGGAPPPPGGAPQYGYAYNPPPPKKSNCLLWVILGIVGLVLVVCVGGPILFFVVAKDQTSKSLCKVHFEQNLSPHVARLPRGKDLDKSDRERVAKLDRLRGLAFWREILKGSDQEQGYFCLGGALQGQQRGLLGPKKPFSQYKDADPIGCCPKGGHKDGTWIMKKNGKVEWASTDSDAYRTAYEQLSDEDKEIEIRPSDDKIPDRKTPERPGDNPFD